MQGSLSNGMLYPMLLYERWIRNAIEGHLRSLEMVFFLCCHIYRGIPWQIWTS